MFELNAKTAAATVISTTAIVVVVVVAKQEKPHLSSFIRSAIKIAKATIKIVILVAI